MTQDHLEALVVVVDRKDSVPSKLSNEKIIDVMAAFSKGAHILPALFHYDSGVTVRV